MKLLFLLSILFFYKIANAECTYTAPYVVVNAGTGKVEYITNLSREEFLEKEKQTSMSENTLGLTVSKLTTTYKATPLLRKKGNKACISIKKIVFTLEPEYIRVYIDSKYKRNSCEYKVIKEHEKFHVDVTQQAINFFKKDIELAIKKAAKKIRPEYVYSSERASNILHKQANQIIQEISPLLDHINKKIKEKNAVIDTPESYRETTSLCKNW